MKVVEYGQLAAELNLVCARRVEQYPELAAVRDASPAERTRMDPEDLIDAGHQWAYPAETDVLQYCFEQGCDAVRPMPLDGYPPEVQVFVLRTFISRSSGV